MKKLIIIIITLIICSSVVAQEKTDKTEFSDKYQKYLDEKKNPTVSALLSIVPGCGHFYNGKYLTGTGYFISRIGITYYLIKFSEGPENSNLKFWSILGIVLFNISDPILAASDAKKFNRQLQQKYGITLYLTPNRIGLSFAL